MQVEAPPKRRRLALKTWHWMIILPVLALGFKVTTWAIAAGLDGRVVAHSHKWGQVNTPGCTTPYSARFWAVVRGRTSTLDYACPHNPAPIEREYVYWPH